MKKENNQVGNGISQKILTTEERVVVSEAGQ